MLGLSSGDVVFCKALPYLLGGVHVVLDATHHTPVLPETIITVFVSRHLKTQLQLAKP